ncbi:hypothetical protein CFC21_048825 [Triticum aestivum]|uniref:Uncharacterized protein n=2 Tax=Triticum aestivum TaxID=4565 RepID=A0A3B6GYF1_WHEAT|nr:hypothetical protein CFC21_048825 [Triticum aestivum]
MADHAAAAAPMTIDFLRARLLSERSVSRASKERADQLAARVAELEEQVRAVTAQRRQAEREAAEVLAVLESRGFCGSLSDVLDSGSDDDADEEELDEPRDATVTTGDPAPRSHGEEGQEQEQPPAKGGTKEEDEDATSGTALQPGGLSWKGRCASPRRARQLKQRHRRSYVYFLASQSDPSPKYRMGQSCRKNKRKELSIAALTESRKEQRDGPRCTDDDGRTKFDGEVGGDDQRSSGDGGGQYVMRRDDDDGEMERVLEKQAELIGQYEAEEKAQTDWEKKFNDTRSSPNKGDAEADCKVPARSGGDKKLLVSRPPKNASEEMGRTAAVSAQGSSSYSTATRRSQDQQGDANSDGCSSRYANSASSGICAVKAPSESSPSVSKVSDWSSSRFHDHADDTRSCRQSSGDIDVESVLQALQRARISLRQKLDRPLPPSQVTLALPAPGDEYRADLYDDDGNSSYREEHSGSSPSRQEILALGAPEDYHGYHDYGREESLWVDGANASLMEKPSGSSPPRQEILALPAPGDDRVPDDIQGDVKIPVSSPGLFRLPTDSFPKDKGLSRSNGHDFELGHDTYKDDEAGVSARQLYDPHGSAATSGRCGVPASSGFTVGGASVLSGIPGLPEDLRKGGGPLRDADLFMQPRLRVHHF